MATTFILNRGQYAINDLCGLSFKPKSGTPVTEDQLSSLKDNRFYKEYLAAGVFEEASAIPDEYKTPTQILNEAAVRIATLESQLASSAGGTALTELQAKYDALNKEHAALKAEASQTIADLKKQVSDLTAKPTPSK